MRVPVPVLALWSIGISTLSASGLGCDSATAGSVMDAGNTLVDATGDTGDGGSGGTGGGGDAGPTGPFRVLVFSLTLGFRHESIEDATAALAAMAAEGDYTLDTTEDPARFSAAGLGSYAVVVFLMTSGDVLDTTQQAAFEAWVHAGGGYVGVHSASDTEYDWPFYGSLVGAYFASHPAIQPATVRIERADHPATVDLPAAWMRTDEWYNFRANPRASVTVLATLDESTYSGGTMGADHPVAWVHEREGGRAFYTALGHTSESYAEPLFRRHLLGAIRWAARRAP
jgi:type 1 glutamine amidotransferase